MKKFVTIILLFVATFTYSQQVASTQGKEFWAVFMRNSTYVTGNTGLELSIIVSAKRACSVTLRNPNSTWTQTINVGANSSQAVIIPHAQAYLDQASTSAVNRGLLITSTDTISVYSSNFYSATFDAANVLPIDALGYEYIIQCYKPVINESVFSITAVEDNTVVDITPSVNVFAGSTYNANQQMTVNLNRGQSVLIQSSTTGTAGDLSGTKVVARDCKKIAVFNGDASTNVPSGNYADHIYEQAFPVGSWGKRFIVTNSKTRSKDIIKITASANGTTIRKNGNLLSTINEGQSYEFELTATEKSAFIETSNPSAVYLYLVSVAQGGSSDGDPSMVWIAPIEQKIDAITFKTFMPINTNASNSPEQHYVNIVTETSNTGNIRLDGAAQTGWQTVNGNSQYSFLVKLITHDAHSLSGGTGFTAHIYGIGNAVSYAYTVGSLAINLAERMYINGLGSTSADVSGDFCQGEEINFSSEVDYDFNSVIWNFGDGNAAVGSETSYTYTQPGNYTVNMQVNTSSSACASFSTAVSFDVNVGRTWETERTTQARYGETITIEGQTLTVTEDITIDATYPSSTGCDSIVHHHVLVSTVIENITATICEGETYNENGFNEHNQGNYTRSFTDEFGIENIINLHLIVNERPNVQIIGNNTLCQGGTSLAVSGGDQYLWSTGETSESIEISEPGNYIVTVTNTETGCSAITDINVYPEVEVAIDYEPIYCHGGHTDLVVTGRFGLEPYTGERTMSVTAGTYTFRITDSNGCTAERVVEITENDELHNEVELTEAYCNDNFGRAEISVRGGVQPYSILWFDGNTQFARDIEPGNYIGYVVTDNVGCSIIDSVKVSREPQMQIAVTHINALCYQQANGTGIVANIIDGHFPYRYNWSNGQTDSIATNLAVGTYTITVTDDHNCVAVESITIQQPSELTVLGSARNASCRGMCDGQIVAVADGGVEPYTYHWNTGYNAEVLTELCYGDYHLTVKDANGCEHYSTYSISQPESMTATAQTTPVSCFGGNDGKITVQVAGGSQPYSFATNEFMYNATNENEITFLSAGQHTIYVKDNRGCTTTITGIIEAPDQVHADYAATDISCKEAKDGTIKLEVNGGTPPYYLTTNAESNIPIEENFVIKDLHSGVYHLIINDEHGCSYSLKNVVIPANETPCLHIPNVFSPNEDGINDTWVIDNIQMFPDAKIAVFNRWGQNIYKGDSVSQPWDGCRNGKKMPSGVYTYVVDLGKDFEKYSGNLSLIY